MQRIQMKKNINILHQYSGLKEHEDPEAFT